MDSLWFCGPFVIQTTLPSCKFHTKKCPVRRVSSMKFPNLLKHQARLHELGLDYGPPEVRLGHKKYLFRNGVWVIEGSTPLKPQAKTSLKKRAAQNKILTEENNYLKLQLELLLDMLADTTARLQVAEEQLRKKPAVDKKCILMIQSDDGSS